MSHPLIRSQNNRGPWHRSWRSACSAWKRSVGVVGNELRFNLLVQEHMASIFWSHIQIQDASFLAFLGFNKCTHLPLVNLISPWYQFSRKLGLGLRLCSQYRDITVFIMNHSFTFSVPKLKQASILGSILPFCSTCIVHKNLSFVYGRN